MTDKERILMVLARNLASTLVCGPVLHRGADCEEDFCAPVGGMRPYVHFATYRKPVVGELVLCARDRTEHDFTISWLVEGGQDGNALLREIGSNRLCQMYNNSYWPIVGMWPDDLLEGEQRSMRGKVIKAIRKSDDGYIHLFSRIEFPAKRVARVWIRERFGGHGQPSQPYAIEFAFTGRMTIKAILTALVAGGYGTKSFRSEANPDQPLDTVAEE